MLFFIIFTSLYQNPNFGFSQSKSSLRMGILIHVKENTLPKETWFDLQAFVNDEQVCMNKSQNARLQFQVPEKALWGEGNRKRKWKYNRKERRESKLYLNKGYYFVIIDVDKDLCAKEIKQLTTNERPIYWKLIAQSADTIVSLDFPQNKLINMFDFNNILYKKDAFDFPIQLRKLNKNL